MISEGFEVTAKDFGYTLEFIVRDNAGDVMDLTGVTSVRLKVSHNDTGRVLFNGLANAVAPLTQGKVEYEVQANDFQTAGNYIGALTLVYGILKEISSAPFNMTVKKAV